MSKELEIQQKVEDGIKYYRELVDRGFFPIIKCQPLTGVHLSNADLKNSKEIGKLIIKAAMED